MIFFSICSHYPFNRDAFIIDRKSTRLNSSHLVISYAVFCLKKKIVWFCLLVVMTVVPFCFVAGGRRCDVSERLRQIHAPPVHLSEVSCHLFSLFFFLNYAATPEFLPLPLPDPLPI